MDFPENKQAMLPRSPISLNNAAQFLWRRQKVKLEEKKMML